MGLWGSFGPPSVVFVKPLSPVNGEISHKKGLIGKNFRVTNLAQQLRTYRTQRGLDQKQKTAGFIQALSHAEQRDPARKRADIPPGGLRSRTPRNGTRAADWAVAACSIRRCPFRTAKVRR